MGADAIATGAGVLTKVYVRPEIFAASASISSAINFLIGLVPLTIVLGIYHRTPTVRFPIVLLVIGCMVIFTTGLSLLLAIAYVNFDDSRSLINIFLMALQYMTPIFYPITLLGPHTRDVIQLNPLYSFLQIFRSCSLRLHRTTCVRGPSSILYSFAKATLMSSYAAISIHLGTGRKVISLLVTYPSLKVTQYL